MKTENNNIIPPITNPLGVYWKQPPTDSILLDDTHALMDVETFKNLSNYECSIPSGVYEGKMWRRGMDLIWFGPSADPDKCSINVRGIIIVY
jgi:hypothetical protein